MHLPVQGLSVKQRSCSCLTVPLQEIRVDGLSFSSSFPLSYSSAATNLKGDDEQYIIYHLANENGSWFEFCPSAL